MVTDPRPAATTLTTTPLSDVAVVMPCIGDPDWAIFDELPEEVAFIVADDSDGKLAPSPRRNVRFYDYAKQRAVMGEHYAAIPHKSSASRNFGHYLAYREGFKVIIALDYDCRLQRGWLEEHLSCLGAAVDAPALRARWINTIEAPGFFARGFPYEYRGGDHAPEETRASGEIKLNMGVWDQILDINGIDKLQCEPPLDPGLRGQTNHVALGNLPICGMNTAFTADLVPAYFFMPDVWVNGWQMSRHDDIWGGYVVKKLMDVRGDLASFGRPVVNHMRQSNLNKVIVVEHYMHLMSTYFYEVVDDAAARVTPGPYADMFGQFVDEYCRRLDTSTAPAHYRQAFRELGHAMHLWSRAFR
jgi:hypothetical protein